MKKSVKRILKKQFKRLGWFGIPVLVIVGLIILWVMKPVILSQYLTSRLGVRVLVGSIDLGMSNTTIEDFKIRNPFGYRTGNAFRATKTLIQYDWRRLFGNPAEIDVIVLENVFLSIEFDHPNSGKNNWTKILEKMPSRSAKEREFILHKLVIENLKVEVRGLVGGKVEKEIDQIEIDEIDSKEGFPTKELIMQIFGGAGIQQYIQELINPTNTIKKLFFNPLGMKSDDREGASID